MKQALLFPGQGSQYVGMAQELYSQIAPVRELYQQASTILGFDLAEISFNGPQETLAQTRYTQPAIFVHSVAVFSILQNDLQFDFVAGHSLGEYSALVAAGVLTFRDAMTAVKHRAFFMQEACDLVPGTMAAIVGLSATEVEAICSAVTKVGKIQPANFNSPEQVTISGETAAIHEALVLAQQKGAKRAVRLTVGGAYHSHLMQPAKSKFAETIRTLKFKSPQVPVIANVTAQPTTDPEEIRRLLVEQITKPVRWCQSVENLSQNGINVFLELGPGKVLSGLVRKTLKGVRVYNVDTLTDVESFTVKSKELVVT